MIDDTCSICERPLATDDDLERFKGRAGDHLCFREYGGDCDPIDWASRFDNLTRASRALAGIDAATLDAVTPAAMRAVMERRGWTKSASSGRPSGLVYDVWDHPTAQHAVSGARRAVLVPADVRMFHADRVRTWAVSTAERHGDVSPAEVLAEALAEVQS